MGVESGEGRLQIIPTQAWIPPPQSSLVTTCHIYVSNESDLLLTELIVAVSSYYRQNFWQKLEIVVREVTWACRWWLLSWQGRHFSLQILPGVNIINCLSSGCSLQCRVQVPGAMWWWFISKQLILRLCQSQSKSAKSSTQPLHYDWLCLLDFYPKIV